MDGLLDLAAKLEFGMTRFFEPDTEAHLKLGGLSIWVDGREHPHSDDGDDGNWLIIYARVEAPGALVELSGPWLRRDEVAAFLQQVEAMSENLSGKAELYPVEPAIKAVLEIDVRGQIALVVEATPDHMTQSHRFRFELDQSYLPVIVRQCRGILFRFQAWSVKG
ncbi:hypothetical protein QOZ96_003396 [Brevundimonas nasdae]|uniref:WapI family immunity protein n=1 Tax=Brevundimonas nasdae TaxID=172043 RepID=UPI0019125E60|nr:hypothetical protein [Brevundimonas nasdae]MBK6026678.1 hypothetical protein [Brevundimonas nasdae]MDQ0453426.1 hypothetical protein [Brevundimonas nasdae]